jgi:iron complex transport system permease protein
MFAGSQSALRELTNARRQRTILMFLLLIVALVGSVILSMARGPLTVAPQRVVEILIGAAKRETIPAATDAIVILDIRLPRTLLAAMIGSCLAASGALMQSLFRNPLADPGIVGISAGAALAAAFTIVLGDRFLGANELPFISLPLAAFAGALVTTLLLYLIATGNKETSVATLLIAGVALGALASAVTGLLIYMADDRQLRDLTFWSLGSLGGATWEKVGLLSPVFILLLASMPFLSRGLNALAIGEAEAFTLGIPVQATKAAIIFLAALATGGSVAAAGIIGFVGIVVPQLLRLIVGSDHRLLLPATALLGAILVVGADTIARNIVAPAELPIGILTATIGAPFFLWLLLKRRTGHHG